MKHYTCSMGLSTSVILSSLLYSGLLFTDLATASDACTFDQVKVEPISNPASGDCKAKGLSPRILSKDVKTGIGSKKVTSFNWNDQFFIKTNFKDNVPLEAQCKIKIAISYPKGCTVPIHLISFDAFTSNESLVSSKILLDITGFDHQEDEDKDSTAVNTRWFGNGRREIGSYTVLGGPVAEPFWTSCKTSRDVVTFDFRLRFKSTGQSHESIESLTPPRQSFVSLDTFSFVLLDQSDPESKKWKIKPCKGEI